MANTGYKAYKTLEQYNALTGEATGVTKPNVDTDPDYVPPVEDLDACPLPVVEPPQPDPEPEPEPEPEPTSTLKLSPSNYDASGMFDSFILQITASHSWTLRKDPDASWVVLGATSGTGNASVQITIQKNGFPEERYMSLILEDGISSAQYCGITQLPGILR